MKRRLTVLCAITALATTSCARPVAAPPATAGKAGDGGPRTAAPVSPPVAAAPASQTDATATTALPDRPEKIVFAPLAFEPPAAAGFRRTLPDGTVVYLCLLYTSDAADE